MKMTVAEIHELMDGLPPGAWVAISTEQGRVLSYGEDAMKVFAEAKKKGERVPFIGRVPIGEMFFGEHLKFCANAATSPCAEVAASRFLG